MELSTEPSQPIDSKSPHSSNAVPSTQRRLWLAQAKSLISYKNTPNKRLKFKGYSTGELFGVGCLNLVSIDADYEKSMAAKTKSLRRGASKLPTLTDLLPH
ncbi:hypothetical protein N7534_012088 [Penicillium rubens]|nr:hypothetical protein N7534_012088 [Penicillium rubens]